MDRKNLVDAIKKLNQLNLTKSIDIKNKEEELKESYMENIEAIVDNGGESDIPENLIIIYNELSDEYEQNKNKKGDKEMSKKEETKEEVKEVAKKEVKEVAKKEMAKKEVAKKEKVEKEIKKESRPQALKRKMQSIKSLDKLLLDEELLAIYDNHKNWITNDYNKIVAAK